MFKVEINDDNAAFEDDKPGEVARILRKVADLIEDGADSGKVRDSNGNIVGQFKWEG